MHRSRTQTSEWSLSLKNASCTYRSSWGGVTGSSSEDACVIQVAGAAPLPDAVERAAESAETDVRTGEPALACQYGEEQEQELESLRQLRLSDDSPAAADAAASSSQSTASVEMRSSAQPATSQAAYSSQARPNEQTPCPQLFVAVSDGEYPGSENVLNAEEGTPSSRALPAPYVQRGPLSPLPGSSNLHNQPAGPQVTADLHALQT